MTNDRETLFRFFRRRRARHLVTRDLQHVCALAQTNCRDIEQIAASFGADRIFDDRFGKIELLAIQLRRSAEAVGNYAD